MKRAFLLALALFGTAATAQTYQVGQFLGNLNDAGRFAWGVMGGGTGPLPHSGPATWTNHATPGNLRHAAQATATIGGRTVPLTLISRVPVAAVANAARGLALANPATAAVTLLGFAAMQGWLTPAGLEWNQDPADNKALPFVRNAVGPATCQISPAVMAGWSQWVADYNAVDGQSATSEIRYNQNGDCHLGRHWTTVYYPPGGFDGYATVPKNPDVQKEKITWDQALPNLSNPSGSVTGVDWKTIAQQLLQRGASLPTPQDQTLSGPSSQPGTSKSTTNSATGNTTTSNTTNNYQYAGNTVTVNTTTNTTVTNNAGDVISEVEEDTQNEVPEDTASDTALPGMPDLYERKYPDGITGVWNEKIASIKTSSLFALVPGLTPNLGDGGCPTWTLHADVGVVDFGTYDVSIPCNVWAFIRIIIIVTALFLARRMIFGG